MLLVDWPRRCIVTTQLKTTGCMYKTHSVDRKTVVCLCAMVRSISWVEDGKTEKPQTLFSVMILQQVSSQGSLRCQDQCPIMAVWLFIDTMRNALSSKPGAPHTRSHAVQEGTFNVRAHLLCAVWKKRERKNPDAVFQKYQYFKL